MKRQNLKNISKYAAVIAATFVTTVAFQNCSPSSFDPNLVGTTQLNSQSSGDGLSQEQVTRTDQIQAASANKFLAQVVVNEDVIRIIDRSFGSEGKVVMIDMEVQGAGPNVRACTGPIERYGIGCVDESEFVLLTQNWGANSYSAVHDIYKTAQSVAHANWPLTGYFTSFIKANGARQTVFFRPKHIAGPDNRIVVVQESLKWVRTHSKACVGPTPSPAPIGEACTSAGESRTNACGTAVCQMSK